MTKKTAPWPGFRRTPVIDSFGQAIIKSPGSLGYYLASHAKLCCCPLASYEEENAFVAFCTIPVNFYLVKPVKAVL